MELAHPGLLFFDPEGERKRETRVRRSASEQADEDKRIFCAHCRNPVTHRDEKIAVGGRYAHTCRNPHGCVFSIGCFRAAPGCIAESASTAEHTWFPGYQWSVAHCAHCDRHLGWRFSAPADGFYGLILDRLIESSGLRRAS